VIGSRSKMRLIHANRAPSSGSGVPDSNDLSIAIPACSAGNSQMRVSVLFPSIQHSNCAGVRHSGVAANDISKCPIRHDEPRSDPLYWPRAFHCCTRRRSFRLALTM